MARSLGVVCVILLLAGCTGSDSVEDVSSEVERLEAEVEVLETRLEASEDTVRKQSEELEAARQIADSATTTVDDECLEELARCEESLFPSGEQEWPPPSPDVWFPPSSGFVTNEPGITFDVFAARSATVTVDGVTAVPTSDWAGGNSVFLAAVTLREGANSIDVVVDGQSIASLDVVYDPSLVRRYGRVLDSRATILPAGTVDVGVEEGCGSGEENACVLYELGIDFGDMDLEPDYGQGDFDAGDVVVEFKRLTPFTIAAITTSTGTHTILTGTDQIWEFYGWGDTTQFDVWNILLDGDAVAQIEGIVPLGD